MQPTIKIIGEKKLVGKQLTTSIQNNRTSELWKSFMPCKKEIKNQVSNELFSLQVYDEKYDFKIFDTSASFQKWAAVEVSDFENIPHGIENFTLGSGMYATFLYHGNPQRGAEFFQYIFETWLPNSVFILDNRPHFEILGEKYKNNDSKSEEEIWIPIKERNSSNSTPF